ncbi:hypothetical protein UFOVP1360_4 [uncultured Caudovirales phage]|uniref:Tail assembly chaperone n=1 Tax=uncultured Caudovirales phage TaxID=2100421 RepID=A0A6J5S1I4_9CAUD|nr:hypothetical protein UFOVP1360_4 [uncultured Caudovirales phage]
MLTPPNGPQKPEVAFHDFDADTNEANGPTPVTFQKFGRVWSVPGAMPSGAVIMLSRLMASGRGHDELEPHELIALAAELIPEETLSKLHAKGLTAEELLPILGYILHEIGADEAVNEGKAQAPIPTV